MRSDEPLATLGRLATIRSEARERYWKKKLDLKRKDDVVFFLLLIQIIDDKVRFCSFSGGQRTNKRDRIEETTGTRGEE
jgi:hypothetical protein